MAHIGHQLTGDSRTVDIAEEIKSRNKKFHKLIDGQKIKAFFLRRRMSVR